MWQPLSHREGPRQPLPTLPRPVSSSRLRSVKTALPSHVGQAVGTEARWAPRPWALARDSGRLWGRSVLHWLPDSGPSWGRGTGGVGSVRSRGSGHPRPSCLSSPSFPLCEACLLQLVSQGISKSHGHPWCQRAVPREQGVLSGILWPSRLVFRTFLRLLPLLSKQWTHRKLAVESCSPFWWRRALSCWGPGAGGGVSAEPGVEATGAPVAPGCG